MTFPMEDQFVPEEFRNELDLGEVEGPDQDEIDAFEDRIANARRLRTAYGEQVDHLEGLWGHDPRREEWRRELKSSLKRYRGLLKDARGTISSAQAGIDRERAGFGELLKGEDRDAFEALTRLFEGYGLGSLAKTIFDYVKEGYQADTIALLLQDTKEYKERFAANEARRKKGLAVLAPAEYLQVEAAYRQIMESAGLPKGFYDSPADFQQWIADDKSPTEIKSRVDMAVAATSQAPESYRQALSEMYGIGQNEIVAYFLDRSKAEPILKKQAAAGFVGAAALSRGIRADRGRMEELAASGVSADEAAQGYARIAHGLESMLGIASRFGSSWSLEQAEDATFGLGGEPQRARLASRERALFGGSPGASAQGLARPYRST